MSEKKELTFEDFFSIYVRSGMPLISVDTTEVDRATATLKSLKENWEKELVETQADDYLKEHGYSFMIWDIVNGWHTTKSAVENTDDPAAALAHLMSDDVHAGVYVMQNFHLMWEDIAERPVRIQLLRDIAKQAKTEYKHVFLVGNSAELPLEIRDLAVSLTFELPKKEDIHNYIKTYTTKLGLADSIPEDKIEGASVASVGMTINEIESALSVAIVTSKGKDIDRNIIFDEKAKAVKRSGLLEYMPSADTMDSVGGFHNLKGWVGQVADAYRNPLEAADYKLPVPKGMLAAGLAGCGKSLVAKALASLFGVPLFRLDVGRLFNSLVGETERQTRDVFKLIEALAPCCVLIDEIEKVMSGSQSSGRTDGGVTSRLIGNFLYFMQEKNTPAYIVATSNEPFTLPGPMIRAGRWDEIWWVDTPNKVERKEIINIHINKVSRDASLAMYTDFMEGMIEASEKMSGAEIENAIKKAMFYAFNDGRREFTGKDIIECLKITTPIVDMKKEEVERSREWAKSVDARDVSSEKGTTGKEWWAKTGDRKMILNNDKKKKKTPAKKGKVAVE